MGGMWSCFKKEKKLNGQIHRNPLPQESEEALSDTSSPRDDSSREVEQVPSLDVVVIENGELIRKQQAVPDGAATNLANLILDAYTVAKDAIHSQRTCIALIFKLCALQHTIWENRQLMADSAFMLEVQEVALEVIEMTKLFSTRGWLSRLNKSGINDESEFHRISDAIGNLQRKHSMEAPKIPLGGDFRSSDYSPSSGQLAWHLKNIGGLHTLADKQRSDLRDFVSRIAPLLTVSSSAVANLVEQEIKVSATAEIPSACCAIRHLDIRLLWWEYLQAEEVAWKEFWDCFPNRLSRTSQCMGSQDVLSEMLSSGATRDTFEWAINKIGSNRHVTSVEIDHNFPPNVTIEDSVRLLLRAATEPMEVKIQSIEQWIDVGSAETNKPSDGMSDIGSDMKRKYRIVQDRSGIPGEGMRMIGRSQEIRRVCKMLVEGRRLVAIVGEAGAGKSAVAAVVADQMLKAKQWQNAYYVNMSRVETVDASAGLICTALSVPLHQGSVPNAPRLMNWLKRCGGDLPCSGWILDGIDSLVQQASNRTAFFSLLTQSLRQHPRLQLILTCRRFPELTDTSRIEEIEHLSRLPDKDAREIAESLLGGVLMPGESHYLVTACEGNPLGVRMAGGCTAAGVCSAVTFMTNIRQLKHMSMSGPSIDGGLGKKSSLFYVGMECINALGPEDRAGLILLTECPPEFTVDLAAAALGKLDRPLQVWSMLWRLMMRGFLRFIPSLGMYRMEEAVVEILEKMCPHQDNPVDSNSWGRDDVVDRDIARVGIIRYHIAIMERILATHRTGAQLSTMRMLERERPGIDQFILHLTNENLVRRATAKGAAEHGVLEFVTSLCEFFVEVGIHFFTRVQQSAVVEAAFQLTSKWQHKLEGWAFARLALVKALLAIGEISEAETVLDDILDLLNEETNKDQVPANLGKRVHAEVAICRARIKHLGGEFRRAEQLYIEGLALQEEEYGKDSFLTSRTLSSLATVQQSLHKYFEGEQAYRQSIRIRKEHQDGNVVEVTTVMHNLASLNHHLGRAEEAERLYIKSLNLREKYIGHINMEVASSLGSLAAVKVSTLEYQDAERLYRRAILMLKEILGEDHMAVADVSTRLAVLLESHGAHEEAGELYFDALEVKERVLGSVHHQVNKMVARIQRVIAKTAESAAQGTVSAAGGITQSLHLWRTYFARRQALVEADGNSTRLSDMGSDMGTDFMSAPSFATHSATDLFLTAQSMGSTFSDRGSTAPPTSPASGSRQLFMMLDSISRRSTGDSFTTRTGSPSGSKGAPTPQLRTSLSRGSGKMNPHRPPSYDSSFSAQTRVTDRYKIPPSPSEGILSESISFDLSRAPTMASTQELASQEDAPSQIRGSDDCDPVDSPSGSQTVTDAGLSNEVLPEDEQSPKSMQGGDLDPQVNDETMEAGISDVLDHCDTDSMSDTHDPPHIELAKPVEMEHDDQTDVQSKDIEREEQKSGLGSAGKSPLQSQTDTEVDKNEMAHRDLFRMDSNTLARLRTVKDVSHVRFGSSDVLRPPPEFVRQGDDASSLSSVKSPETVLRPPPTFFTGADMVENSAFLTLTLEDDLLESTNISPEHINALQSIVNPLFLDGSDLHSHPIDSPRTQTLVNTHASFHL
ncbi:hypothetical protein BSKO_02308 [Bryopsis sp. KO-2023]|nr:hypothetical protein BSKO_02308 [Bryopsis sp. KO-2023]